MTKAGCRIHCGAEVTGIEAGHLQLESGNIHEFDAFPGDGGCAASLACGDRACA